LPVNPEAVIVDRMTEFTRIVHAIDQGEPAAASQLLPLVYAEVSR
jgi:hypothetical protein